jgi:SAM-dependent methyltransferase
LYNPVVPPEPKAAEAAFYDDYYQSGELDTLNGFYLHSAGVLEYERRIYSECEGKRVLEYGCGIASNAVRLAQRGADVCGIDISSVAIERARASAAGITRGRVEYRVQDAHDLQFPDGSFDLVCGTGIVHHLDIDRAMPEVRRVLKVGGRAVFYEPVAHNPLVNLYRAATPSKHTPDEHPLTMRDIGRIRSGFASMETTFFDLFSIFAIPFLRLPGAMSLFRMLEKVDRTVLGTVTPMHRWAATVVLDGCR